MSTPKYRILRLYERKSYNKYYKATITWSVNYQSPEKALEDITKHCNDTMACGYKLYGHPTTMYDKVTDTTIHTWSFKKD